VQEKRRVKIQFNLKALVRFLALIVLFFALAFVIKLIEEESLDLSSVLIAAIILIGLVALYMFFRLPIFAFLGMYASGARLTGTLLEELSEDTEGRDFLLYQHAFFSYQLGNFTEALVALDAIEWTNIPEPMCAMVGLNRGLVLEALFRAREAEETLQTYDVSDYDGRMCAFWQAYLANAKAGLGLDLDEALQLAESAFTNTPSAKIAAIMGHVLWRMEHFEAAASWLQYALRRMPRRGRHFKSYVFFLQGRLMWDTGDSGGAEEALKRALSLAPSAECRQLYIKNWNGGSRRRKRAART
jgi:tetratricopeptide (TPR) repeat protein